MKTARRWLFPRAAVFSDEIEEEKQHVFVKSGENIERRMVRTGRSIDDKIEILAGVNEGDVILLEGP